MGAIDILPPQAWALLEGYPVVMLVVIVSGAALYGLHSVHKSGTKATRDMLADQREHGEASRTAQGEMFERSLRDTNDAHREISDRSAKAFEQALSKILDSVR